jgi:hypothetical protein
VARANACYVFGVIPLASAVPDEADPAPLAESVEALVVGGVAALAARVVLDDWTGENPRHPEWLVPRVRAHDRVLTAVAATGPVIPFRFGVIHSTRAAMAATMAGRTGGLASALRRLGPSQEWTVTIDPMVPSPKAEGPPGRRYLLTRGGELSARDRARAALSDVLHRCDEWHIPTERLAPDAEGASRVACLIPRAETAEVLAGLQSVGADDKRVRISVLGPFPPYHFVEHAR